MKQSLNYSWNFIPSFEEAYLNKLPEGTTTINIPHTVKEVPYNYFSTESYQFISTYEKYFDVDNYDKNRRYFLRFEGFMVKGKIYLNDHYYGEYVSIYNPVEIEISDFIKDKNNRLIVVLDSHEDELYPPFGFALDYQTFGGIYREVYLIDEPEIYLRNIYPHGNKKGHLVIDYDVIGGDLPSISFRLFDMENNLVKEFDEKEITIDNPTLWDISHPYLYTLEVIIEGNKYVTRFGFRDIKFDENGFYLNGEKVKLVGLNRHQGYPYMGYAASKSLQRKDAEILKYEVGVNVVRTSHYPQSHHFLERCDEIGLLVVNEIPGWQHIGQSETWRNQCFINTESMVKEQRSHTSVIAYGVRIDESVDDHELYTKTNEIAHKIDPYRPTIGVRNFANSELLEDIYGYNDFICDSLKVGLTKPNKVKHQHKALLVTEYLGHMDPIKATSDQEKKIEVALRHAKVINDNFKYKQLAGAIGWCFVDYHTHVDFGGGDYICPHGVYDLYRNPKYSSYIYASQQDDFPVLKVLTNMKPGDVPEAIFNNIYVATNCDYIELYKDDELVDRFYPKNNQFESLKHPPILIDDIVGKTFKEAKFGAKSSIKIAKALSYAAIHGFNHLPLRIKIFLAYCMVKYKVNYTELVGYWNKYIGAWGGKAKTYKFKGYKNGELVKECEVGPSTTFDLKVDFDRDTLVNEDTYDTLPIRLSHVDNHGNVMEYSQRIVEISTTGPIQLVGPTHQTLLCGQLTLYIKSEQKGGDATITIKMDDVIKTINLKVK